MNCQVFYLNFLIFQSHFILNSVNFFILIKLFWNTNPVNAWNFFFFFFKTRSFVKIIGAETSKTNVKIRSYNANVIIHGSVWDETDLEARQVAESQNATYVSPFDHELIWFNF